MGDSSSHDDSTDHQILPRDQNGSSAVALVPGVGAEIGDEDTGERRAKRGEREGTRTESTAIDTVAGEGEGRVRAREGGGR
mmetsp:Transcript_14536/g.25507  ORF Transcript_14536/g.25507 Transcript_14536/m.25507 type:complete len:81 (-) Transcript_14536:79-321(-)